MAFGSLIGKVIVVTGGFGVLGEAVAEVVANAGARVALVDTALAGSAGSVTADTLWFGGVDLADEAAGAAVMQQIFDKAGQIDGLVNTAGGFRFDKIEGGSLDNWDALYRMNVRTAVVSCKTALPFLLQSGAGRIVNVGALGANKAAAGMGPYAASKIAVAKLTETLADELKDRGVTVNAVLPSILDTPRNRLDMSDADFGRWVKPKALAEVIVFLLSDAARAVTGALVPVSGRV